MISIEQCRGARGILGWTQQDLADASGLSKTAINNFEKEHSDIKAESLKAIALAFETAGIEFIGQTGVQKKSRDVKILSGKTMLDELLADIHTQPTALHDELLILSPQKNVFLRLTDSQRKRHAAFLESNNIRQRFLCPASGDQRFLNQPNSEYRFLSDAAQAAGMTCVIYGNKVALELWNQVMIMLINSTEAHRAERSRFEFLWNEAEKADIPE